MKTSGILIFLFLLILVGCNKDSAITITTTPSEPGDNNSSERSVVIADRTFEGLNGIVDSYFTAFGLKSATLGTCPLISTTVVTSYPIIITCDWGTGCTSEVDMISRSGKIIISVSGPMNIANSVATFTFTNFVTDGNKITGTHRITYKGLNAGNNWPRYAILTEAKIEFPDTKFITYRAEYIRLQSEGSDTPLIQIDDVWRIEGSSSGTTKEGVAWTASYPSALVKKASCKWISSGIVLITPKGDLPRTIDFGDGTCNNYATLTIGDKVTNIVL